MIQIYERQPLLQLFNKSDLSLKIKKMTTKTEVKQDKKNKVAELTEILKSASSLVFVNYEGMNVSLVEDLRTALNEAGGKMLVAKNTLLKLAGQAAGLPKEAFTNEVLRGQTAVIIGVEDAVSPIQALGKFSKETELPVIKSGIVESLFQNAEGILKISKLPNREDLQAQVVGSIGAPLYGLVGVLSANMQSLVFILEEVKNNGGKN